MASGKEPPPRNPPRPVIRRPRRWLRVHQSTYRPAQFHPGGSGNARFSPIKDVRGVDIPTIYAASTLKGAFMETIFHDVPTPPAGFQLDLGKIADDALALSALRPLSDLRLLDLSVRGLKRMGLLRTEMIDTPPTEYSRTRRWAQWLHGSYPKAHGLIWTSRQDDDAKAIMLFGDRVDERDFEVINDRLPLIPNLQEEIVCVAEEIGIEQILSPH